MFISIFTDELGMDITRGLPIIKSWGLDHVDLRGLVYGSAFESLDDSQLADLRRLLDDHGMKVGCLQSSLAKVKTLSGLLPICAACKKIRDDEGYWNQIEAYIHKHSEATFSHGICPECAKRLYPEYSPSDGK